MRALLSQENQKPLRWACSELGTSAPQKALLPSELQFSPLNLGSLKKKDCGSKFMGVHGEAGRRVLSEWLMCGEFVHVPLTSPAPACVLAGAGQCWWRMQENRGEAGAVCRRKTSPQERASARREWDLLKTPCSQSDLPAIVVTGLFLNGMLMTPWAEQDGSLLGARCNGT